MNQQRRASALLVFCVLFSTISDTTATTDLQNQIFGLLGGEEQLTHDPCSGLLLPPSPRAVAWLKSFWDTGNPKPSASPSLLTEQSSTWGGLVSKQPAITCGLPTGQPIQRKNILITPAGDSWTANVWLDKPELASFDVIAIYHGSDENFTCPLCAQVIKLQGPKWRLFYELTNNKEVWDPIAKIYDRIMLPDDDLTMDTCTINMVFTVMEQHDLLLAQPSVCEINGSGTWRPELHQRPQFILRYTTFVEVMSPAFRMDFFDAVVTATFSKYWTYVGWGLDSVWPALLHYPKTRIAVLDALCMTHIPSAGGLGAAAKPNSIYRPGLSPYSPKQEELIVFSAFNYTPASTATLGEPFMSLRVVGAVPNPVVQEAMVRFTDTLSTSSGSAISSTSSGSGAQRPFILQTIIASIAALFTVVLLGQVFKMHSAKRRHRPASSGDLKAFV